MESRNKSSDQFKILVDSDRGSNCHSAKVSGNRDSCLITEIIGMILVKSEIPLMVSYYIQFLITNNISVNLTVAT